MGRDNPVLNAQIGFLTAGYSAVGAFKEDDGDKSGLIGFLGDHDEQSNANWRHEPDYSAISCRHGLPWGAGTDQLAYQEGEVVTGNVEQVALVQALATAQPGAAHANAIEIVGEGSLDQLGAQLAGLSGDP